MREKEARATMQLKSPPVHNYNYKNNLKKAYLKRNDYSAINWLKTNIDENIKVNHTCS